LSVAVIVQFTSNFMFIADTRKSYNYTSN